jgi:hypothetical protein
MVDAIYGDIYSLKMLNQILNKVDFIKEYNQEVNYCLDYYLEFLHNFNLCIFIYSIRLNF